jgi:SAM-dependent methyltransferase
VIHSAAEKGFGRGARDYEAGRPSYPVAAVDLIVAEFEIGPSTFVVDVGAGTGKFTRLLVPTGARLLAVEPVAEMRAVFSEAVPGVEIVEGTGESLPLGDGSVDVVTAAQSFHWVDPVRGAAECHRVLRQGGGVALLWNSRDTTIGFTRRIKELMDRVAGTAPRYASEHDDDWKDAFANHGGFTALQVRQFRLDHPTSLDATLARVSSTSYVSAMDDAARAAVLDEVRTILDEEGVGETFTEPYVTEVFWCRKR